MDPEAEEVAVLLSEAEEHGDGEDDEGSTSIDASDDEEFPEIIGVVSLKGGRPRHANPLACLYFWCMACIRSTAASFDPAKGLPFEVQCVLDAVKSVLCQQCSERRDKCFLVCFAALFLALPCTDMV